jgi:hypothetical protein
VVDAAERLIREARTMYGVVVFMACSFEESRCGE